VPAGLPRRRRRLGLRPYDPTTDTYQDTILPNGAFTGTPQDALDCAWAADRHRAMPDVEVTSEVLRRIVDHGAATGRWRTMRQLRTGGGYPAKGGKPEQESLF
jgi:hypothetical protein